MVRFALDERLSIIAGGGNDQQVVFNLIGWAERHGRVDDLLRGALDERPTSATLAEMAQELGASTQQATTAAVSPSPTQSVSANPSSTPPKSTGSIAYSDSLLSAVEQGELVPFVGAGLSIGAGLPGWYDLIAELANRSGQEMPPAKWASGDMLMRIAQTYVNQEGLHSLISVLKDRLDTTGIEPTAAHRALARLPVNLVFTANYDNLLERAFREAGKRVEVVVNDGDVLFMQRGKDRVNVVKLYGDLNQPRTIVLAQSQGERFFQDRPALVSLLETELARSSLLYLGWSHADPYFNLVIGQMLERYQDMMRPGYAAMFDVPEAEAAELRRKQIRVAYLPPGPDKTAQLATWLTGLGT